MVEAVLAPFESVEVREVRERDVEAEQDGEGDDGGADPENTQVDVVQDRAQEEPTKVRIVSIHYSSRLCTQNYRCENGKKNKNTFRFNK